MTAGTTIEQQLQAHGIHPTAARILVLQKLSELTHPVSMTELETELETMDKSTIFRTLNVLLEHHAIHSFEDGSGSTTGSKTVTSISTARSAAGHSASRTSRYP